MSQEQFRQAILVLKRTVERLDQTQAELARVKAQNAAGGGGSEEVDLSKLGNGTSTAQAVPSKGFHGPQLAEPNWKVYWDFDVVNRPGQDNLSFKNYHNFLFFELIPRPDIQFSFDIGPQSPKYYELDLQATPRLQVRIGKIWIPFDDLSPHNIFGGRVNVSQLQTSGSGLQFLPDIWADMGVGIKYQLLDTRLLAVEAHLYIVNGFGNGGNVDPVANNGAGSSAPYPGTGTTSGLTGVNADNNRDKAIGGRVRATFLSGLSLGASFYTGRWTDETDPSERLNIFGLDAQLRVQRVEFRAGISVMNAGVDAGPGTIYAYNGPTSFSRAGGYLEAGMRFGRRQEWKGLLRTGLLSMDNRANLPQDENIIGGTILYKPGLIEYSLEYSRDLLVREGKLSYSYTAARVIIGL